MAYDDEKVEPGKQRIDVVIPHFEKCGLIFSSTNVNGTCTATGTPCHQGWLTCRDKDNYFPADFPIQICSAIDNAPAGYLPFLKPKGDGISHSPTEPDPETSIGKRSTLRTDFLDAPHDDVGIDPYIDTRPYDALERGTFWSKLRARFPFYQGRLLEWYTGYMHEPFSLSNLKRRTFVMENFSGWGPRNLPQIISKDPMKFADNDRAVYPPKSTGVLKYGMTASGLITEMDIIATDLDQYDLETFEPVGIVKVGNEGFTYTGINKVIFPEGVRLTGVTRTLPEQYETVKESHNANDLAQKCAYFYRMKPSEIYNFFLVTVAALDSGYIPFVDWTAEDDTWISGLRLTRIVCEPQGVVSHINEIIPQAATWGLWFDDENDLVQYRVNRPIDYNESVTSFTDTENLIGGSAYVEDESNRLVNEVYIAHGQRDPTKRLDDISNYRSGITTASPTSQSPRENGQRRIRTMYARWSPQANGPELFIIADRLLITRATTPVKIQFAIEAKDDSIKFADFLDLTTLALLDAFGAVRPNVRFRIIEAKQGEKGLDLAAREEFYRPVFGRWSPDTFPTGYGWDDATPEEQRKYIFWSEADGTLGVNSDPGKEWL